MSGMQLDIYGGEVEAPVASSKDWPLSPSQHEILRMMRQYGAITSTQAGTIVHAHREDRGAGKARYRSSDGCDAMKRLRSRGLVRRARPGTWVAVSS